MDDMTTKEEELSYEELLEKITHPKQLAYLEAFPKICVTTKTTKAIGVSEKAFYIWVKTSETFKLAITELKKRVDATRLEENVAEVHRRGLEKSDLLLMFETKKLDNSYRERMDVIPFTGTIKVELSVPRPGELSPPETKQIEEGSNG